MTTPKFPEIKVEAAACEGLPMVAIATVSQIMSRNNVSPHIITDFRNAAFLTDRDIMDVIAEYVTVV